MLKVWPTPTKLEMFCLSDSGLAADWMNASSHAWKICQVKVSSQARNGERWEKSDRYLHLNSSEVRPPVPSSIKCISDLGEALYRWNGLS